MPGFFVPIRSAWTSLAPIGLILPLRAEPVTYRNVGIVPSEP